MEKVKSTKPEGRENLIDDGQITTLTRRFRVLLQTTRVQVVSGSESYMVQFCVTPRGTVNPKHKTTKVYLSTILHILEGAKPHLPAHSLLAAVYPEGVHQEVW